MNYEQPNEISIASHVHRIVGSMAVGDRFTLQTIRELMPAGVSDLKTDSVSAALSHLRDVKVLTSEKRPGALTAYTVVAPMPVIPIRKRPRTYRKGAMRDLPTPLLEVAAINSAPRPAEAPVALAPPPSWSFLPIELTDEEAAAMTVLLNSWMATKTRKDSLAGFSTDELLAELGRRARAT